jgi:Thiamine monophosphate synthase
VIPTLLAITPDDGRDLREWARCLRGNPAPGVLIRAPHLATAELRILVDQALDNFPLVAVHDRHPQAALITRATGALLHFPAGTAPSGGGFGASTHDEAELQAALSAGATYALLSPVWSPASKPEDRRAPLGLDRFLAAARGRPVFALGGVTPARFAEVLRGGGAGAAVLGGLAGPDPTSALAAYRAAGHAARP